MTEMDASDVEPQQFEVAVKRQWSRIELGLEQLVRVLGHRIVVVLGARGELRRRNRAVVAVALIAV